MGPSVPAPNQGPKVGIAPLQVELLRDSSSLWDANGELQMEPSYYLISVVF